MSPCTRPILRGIVLGLLLHALAPAGRSQTATVRAAAEANAAFLLGQMLEGGHDAPANLTAAVRWYEVAAQDGCGPAAERLGDLYASGRIGARPDPAAAARWYLLAAGLHDASATAKLAKLYATGTGVPRNQGIADRLAAMAGGGNAARGSPPPPRPASSHAGASIAAGAAQPAERAAPSLAVSPMAAASAPNATAPPPLPPLSFSDATTWIQLASPQDTESATVTVSNVSGVAIGSVAATSSSGAFALTSTCPAHAAAATTCTITATASSASAPQRETVELLSPTGGVLGETDFASARSYVALAAVPATLDFGGVSLGDTVTRQVTVTNAGGWDTDLASTITGSAGVAASGCDRMLRAGGSCTLTVSFTPVALGAYTGSITTASLSTPSQATIAISGSGLPASPTTNTTSLSFAGTSGETQPVVLSNPTGHPITVLGATAGPSFVVSSPCTTLAPGGTCTLSIRYQPAPALAGVAATDQLSVFTGQPAAVNQVALSVAANAPNIAISQSSIQFGSREVGTTGTSEPITITNNGQAAATVGIQSAGDFIASSGCGTLAPGASCTASISFAPSASSERDGLVLVTGAGGMRAIALAGQGFVPPPKPESHIPLAIGAGSVGGSLALSLPIIAPNLFGRRSTPEPVGIQVSPKSVAIACAGPCPATGAPLLISNEGGGQRHLKNVVIGPFAATGCDVLPGHGRCTVTVTYPLGAGTASASGVLIVTDQDSALPLAVVPLQESPATAPMPSHLGNPGHE